MGREGKKSKLGPKILALARSDCYFQRLGRPWNGGEELDWRLVSAAPLLDIEVQLLRKRLNIQMWRSREGSGLEIELGESSACR